jgi:hypothetical protein
MDSNFKTLINMMETDITAQDYNEHKSALRYMFTYGKTVGIFRLVTGEPGEDDVYLLSGDFYRTVQEFFEEPPEIVTVSSEEQAAE